MANGNPAVGARRRRRYPRNSRHRPWADLPDPVLYFVSRRLATVVEYAAFAGTCKAWRSAAAHARGEFMASQAPLLCWVDGSCLYDPVNNRSFKHNRLRGLMEGRNAEVVNVCHGYLVVKHRVGNLPLKRLWFLNLFTGEEFGDIPVLPPGCLYWVVLTAPPSSPDCVVIACLKRKSSFQYGSLLFCRRGDTDWCMRGWYGAGKPLVRGQHLCALEWRRSTELTLIHGPYLNPTLVSQAVQGREVPPLQYCICMHLVDLGGLLLFMEHWGKQAIAYRVGAPQPKLERVKDLGGRAVLVSRGGCAVSPCPGKWGGEPDCIYFICGGGPLQLQAMRVEDGEIVEPPFGLAIPDPQKKQQQQGPLRAIAFWVLPSLGL